MTTIRSRAREFDVDSVRSWLRANEAVQRSRFLLPTLRGAYHAIDLVRIRKNRSYLHGLLFDLKAGKDPAYHTEGMSFRIVPEQFPRSYRSRLWFDIYEGPERALARKWLKPNASVLELGGCIGVVSCVVNKLLDQPNNHVVVEANPTLIDVLTENRDANGCSFHIENCIISRAAEADFYVGKIMTANRKDSGVGQEIKIGTDTLEALEVRHGIKFDTLILDIEGGELDFFTENAERLAEIDLVLIELHQRILTAPQLELCTSILEQAGLRRVDTLNETEVWARAG